MGTKIGIFAAMGLLLLILLLVFSIAAGRGLFKDQRWALVLAMILTGLVTLGALASLANGFHVLAPHSNLTALYMKVLTKVIVVRDFHAWLSPAGPGMYVLKELDLK